MKPVLLTDFGSTYTKLTAVDLDAAKLLGTAQAYTTVASDVRIGFQKALDALLAQTGPLTFAQSFACSSAAGGLRMMVSGLVPELTMEAARLASLGAGAKIVGQFSFELTQDDLESIVVTPYKISRSNGTKPDKHIDCIISVKSRKNFTARFNVRAPGEDDYSIRESREYQSGERVEETTADIEKEFDIGGARYVFDGWYKELHGSVTDEPDPKEKVSQDEWEEGYEPTDEELKNGVVNFYAHYVLADIDPDTGVETDFFGLPLMLCTGAAVLGCKNRKKEEDE